VVGGRRHSVSLTVLLTRPEGRNEELAERLRGEGLTVVVEPLVAVEPLETGPIDVGAYDWVVVTSATGARLLRRRMTGPPRRVAAVGRATAAAWGEPVDLIPTRSSQDGLLAELPRPAGRVLLAAAEGARPLLAEELGADFVALYRTIEREPDHLPDADLAVVASPSGARSLARHPGPRRVVTIGAETSGAAREAGLDVVAEAETQDADGLVAAVLRAAR
jgi:hydroxymethylbilane synthase